MRLTLQLGDLTRCGRHGEVDAIVNAANSSLYGGGGVDGAIHRAGGPAVLAACRELRATVLPNGLPVGEAVATTAGQLPVRWVIHTVGPIRGRGTAEQLRSCYVSALAVGADLGARTIAFPLISAGAYRWPIDDAITVARDAIEAAEQDGTAILVLREPTVFRRAQEILGGDG